MGKRIPLKQALLWVGVSTLVCTGAALGLWGVQRRVLAERLKSESYVVQRVLQRAPRGPRLGPECLAELLSLSADEPTNLLTFDVRLARQQLLSTGLFKTLELSTAPPGTVVVDCHVRTPVAFLADYSNLGLDADGVALPVRPYLEPPALPEVFLGLGPSDDPVHLELPRPEVELALELLEKLSGFEVRRIDVSLLRAESAGRREVVVVLEEVTGSCTLRLCPESIDHGLAHYALLRERLPGGPVIIDLRSDQLALLQSTGESL